MTTRSNPPTQDLSVFPWAQLMNNPSAWALAGQGALVAEPIMRNAARAQLEFSSLVGTRVRAWAGIPETLARCRTPVDLIQAQTAFWQSASQDYASAAHRVMAAWSELAQSAASGTDSEGQARDFMTLPEATEERRRPGESRRAA